MPKTHNRVGTNQKLTCMTTRNLDIQEMQSINGGGPLTNLLGGLTNLVNNTSAAATVGVGVGVQAGNISLAILGNIGVSVNR
jgi:hypothetical protein